jgi:hypothetical protein
VILGALSPRSVDGELLASPVKEGMGVTPPPSKSSAWLLSVPATTTSCDAKFPVEGVAVVFVCGRWNSSERSASLSLLLVVGSVRWCLSLSVEWVSSVRSECV